MKLIRENFKALLKLFVFELYPELEVSSWGESTTLNSPNIVGHSNFLKPTIVFIVKVHVDYTIYGILYHLLFGITQY